MMDRVPELSAADYGSGDARRHSEFCAALLQSLQQFGFVIIREHGLSTQLLDDAYRLAESLFAMDGSEKRRYQSGLRGYTPFGTEHAKNNPYPDLKEFWQIGREVPPGVDLGEPFAPNIWPTELPDFRANFLSLYTCLDDIARLLLAAIAPGLQLPQDYFDSRVRHGNSVLRVIHYPPIPSDADPGCERAAAHEDINFLTIMVAAKGAGLELLDSDGQWIPVQSDPRNLIVNSGDMLARLTNGVIPAKTHRVVNPSGANVSRYSMPFFMHPTSTTSLRCLPSCTGQGAKYADINAGEFLEQRLVEIGLRAGRSSHAP